MDFQKKFFHIMFIPRHRGKTLISGIVLPVMAVKHLFEAGIIKKPDRLVPAFSCQICKMKEIPDFAHARDNFVHKHLNLKGKIVLSPV